MDPEHDRHLGLPCLGGRVHVQVEAVLTIRRGTDTVVRRIDLLLAQGPDLVGRPDSGPGRYRPRWTPTQIAYRRCCVRNPLIGAHTGLRSTGNTTAVDLNDGGGHGNEGYENAQRKTSLTRAEPREHFGEGFRTDIEVFTHAPPQHG